MVSDKTIQRLLELIQLYKQNPWEKILIFTIYQNYTLALRQAKVPTFSALCDNIVTPISTCT